MHIAMARLKAKPQGVPLHELEFIEAPWAHKPNPHFPPLSENVVNDDLNLVEMMIMCSS